MMAKKLSEKSIEAGKYMKKEFTLNRKTLKTVPLRKDDVTTYKEIYLVPTGLKHDSGWMQIAIVGKKDDGSYEVAAYPDDVVWDMRFLKQAYDCTGMRNDCSYPQGILHFWGNDIKFIVQEALSSTTIMVINIKK